MSLILTFIIFQTTLSAQNIYKYSQFSSESREFIKIPNSWNPNDFTILGLMGAAAYGLTYLDSDVRDIIKENQNFPVVLMEAGKYYGEPLTSLVLGTAMIGMGSKNTELKKTGFEILQSFVYTGTVTLLVKVIAGRSRPYLSDGPNDFGLLGFTDDRMSFFSGHSSLAFSLSTILAGNSSSPELKVLFFAPAIITAISRIYHDKHWLSDVVIGSAVGILTATWVLKKHEQNQKTENLTQFPVLIMKISL